ELLQAENRSTEILLSIGHTLREVGAVSEARALLEEAYNKEAQPALKQQAALVRALVWTDLDDQIRWLERADAGRPEVKASLATARGHQAHRQGQEDEAARQFRE